jgi:phage gp36-like protein
MAYSNQADISSQVGGDQNLIPFLDDSQTGTLNTSLLATLITIADAEVDGYIAPVYSTPVSPVPPKLKFCSIIFVCEELYRRRGVPKETNPYTALAERLRDDLREIGSGELNLDVNTERAFAQVSAVTRGTIYGVDGSNSPSNTM